MNGGIYRFICHIIRSNKSIENITTYFISLSFCFIDYNKYMLDTIKALNEGNHLAYEQLFDSWYEPLCRYAFSIIRDMEDAEDIVQKTFCKLWDQRETLNIKSSINSYLYRMVHNESLNAIHQKTSHQEHNLNYISTMNSADNSVMEHIIVNDLQLAIDKTLTSLPPQCRRVFEMSRMDQLSYSEIAKELDISINTVENHVSKALKIFRVELKEFILLCLILQLLK